ncbi:MULTISPECIES: hypothetical protein [unclassified Devosia]|uniref:hypothetical protein n=1 Tax=unclassified Devosia TaxID=196773 RepID=UPI00145E1122|nr:MULTISPECIES: hypothetical protein [unclassified Devosia]MBJ6986296.1 hypothetical protein [Devosia sp. MC521]QMW64224.1 hypothetical protein H4N61_07970 [Devosia sp. MC521]
MLQTIYSIHPTVVAGPVPAIQTGLAQNRITGTSPVMTTTLKAPSATTSVAL